MNDASPSARALIEAPLIEAEGNILPYGIETFYLRSFDRSAIRVARVPALGPCRGTILLTPGWAEFLEKYGEVLSDLQRRGFGVLIYDPRGQGLSQHPTGTDDRGLIDDFDKPIEDLSMIVREMEADFAPPFYVMAHSMGGLITLEWLRRHGAGPFAAAILSAPLTGLFGNSVSRSLIRGLARTGTRVGAKRLQLGFRPNNAAKFEGNTLTHDPVRHERFRQLLLAEPKADAGPPKMAWLNTMMGVIGKVNHPRALSAVSVPILLVSPSEDVTVEQASHKRFADRYENVDYVEIEGAYHEILMETDPFRSQFWQAFDRFFHDHTRRAKVLPGPSSARPSSTRSSRTAAS